MNSNGFPGGPVVKESALRHKGNPWSRNIPHATEPLRPGAPAADAVPLEPVLPTREATAGEAHTPQRRAAPTCHC